VLYESIPFNDSAKSSDAKPSDASKLKRKPRFRKPSFITASPRPPLSAEEKLAVKYDMSNKGYHNSSGLNLSKSEEIVMYLGDRHIPATPTTDYDFLIHLQDRLNISKISLLI
jgi:hypothetical protein